MIAVEEERATAEAAAAGKAVKGRYVKQVFSEIAPTYDRVNHLISFRTDVGWRKRAVAALQVERNPDGCYLDLCAGTMDIASQIQRVPGFRGFVAAADFAQPMLLAGEGKISRTHVGPVTADALALPLRAASVSAAIVVFGIRNVTDLDGGLREVYRVLRPGGRFVILEFASPPNPLVRAVYGWYFHHVLPRVGNAVAGHRTAYGYLPKSVTYFPREPELARRMESAGFRNVHWRSFTFGVVAMHVGDKS